MFTNKSDYDRGVNTFSPEGRIFQVEYAMEAVKLGTTAVGIQLEEGTILAAEKRISSRLLIPSSLDKIMKVDDHIGAAIAGLISDGKKLIDQAREDTNHHRFMYDEPMSIETCAQSICDISLKFGEGKNKVMSRPYGVALLLAGCDRELIPGTDTYRYIPRLFHTDPSGTFMSVECKAIGSAAEGAQTKLSDEYYKSMPLEKGELLCIQTLKQVMEDKIDESNVEMAIVSAKTGKFTSYTTEQVRALIQKAQAEESDA
ncbi:putative Proteasome subunit alpha type-5-A [Monocercomonoides exilis]|uniref:putative Proteasome subunit alpha type-5-A n=1 Tax=Monocercomonoides exilis TaxID=2049356 RepID=UPI003559998D|nr:putative Proteasome subunit alpha type-5-A [Monocercomonoides exilis]|eukprot:MONOS_3848.1-p1 / transcript=MONOS_3848.1 / gene=MONOS_3848 / organism=Monocercomonoides_exilis_PA203 / gene_product=Proteasome subunit alpha type-5-A / transcript_product=Proteasome subunit alpha type-5-A / location=Mono_scaffold00095:9223-10508(-) / protein_length=258 / sequence_SO=supercontig / SO=protein_coding / is_pseudo=false